MSQTNNPENSLPYHLRGAFRGYEIALARYLKKYDLPISQFYILRLQWHPNGNSQKGIAERAFMSESVASQVIQAMESRSFVLRKPNPIDSRSRLVSLTPRGSALRERIAKEGIHISTTHAPEISKADMKTAMDVLKKVKEGFDLYNAQYSHIVQPTLK
jgi:DNA-binding MarR family transcriptional regulator